jgi:hypothetical protein
MEEPSVLIARSKGRSGSAGEKERGTLRAKRGIGNRLDQVLRETGSIGEALRSRQPGSSLETVSIAHDS